MYDRADSHVHLFKPGWAGALPESCRHVQPDEATLYEALAAQHRVKQVLAVGYAGEAWCRDNNSYLARVAAERPFVRPVAYFQSPADLSITVFERLARQRFVGISLYLFDSRPTDALTAVPKQIWQWLTDRRWLTSVNSRGEHWHIWREVLDRSGELRLLISHLGLPPAVETAPDAGRAREANTAVTALASYPQVRVKLSGFYALTKPTHDYPHRAVWPHVEWLIREFGADRLLWGSDFYPAMEHVSFPQTYGLFAEMPFLVEADRRKIEGDNLINLLSEIR